MSEEPNSKHLDQIIGYVRQVGAKQQKKPAETLDNLYGEAGEMLKDFQSNINRCKKYNQAKINRKYQMLITQLHGQLKKTKEKLKIQQDARSPTKRHVTDILDQMVKYKQQNQNLKKQLEQHKNTIKQLTNKNQSQAIAIKKLQNTQPKTMIQRLPSLNSGLSVSDAIKQYLKDKEKVRNVVQNTKKSGLQKFLNSHLPKTWNWTIGCLLEQVDKWAEGIQPTKQVDMWRIRSSVAKSFSEYLDDSASLTRPASFTKRSLSPIATQPHNLRKKQSRFSVFGDRKQRSIMDSGIH